MESGTEDSAVEPEAVGKCLQSLFVGALVP